MTFDKCPECGEPLEATVKVYLSDVVIVDGEIKSYDVASQHLGVELDIYCADGHGDDVESTMIDASEFPGHIKLRGGSFST